MGYKCSKGHYFGEPGGSNDEKCPQCSRAVVDRIDNFDSVSEWECTKGHIFGEPGGSNDHKCPQCSRAVTKKLD